MGKATSFHNYNDAVIRADEIYDPALGWGRKVPKPITIRERSLDYRVYVHDHPYVPELVRRLIRGSVDGLQGADTDYVTKADGSYAPLTDDAGAIVKQTDGTPIPLPVLFDRLYTATRYAPSALIDHPYPVNDIDFSSSGAYSVYNWEIFYHIPLAIGIQLSQNQHYADAQKWFQYIFDPTDDSAGPTPERFWKTKPFQYTDVRTIEEILVNLATNTDPELRQQTIDSINAWKDAPFRPFVVARYRQTAFMYKAVMAYLDNLIAWGDSLFATDSVDAINEATQLYIMASNILGPKPQALPKKGSVRPKTYKNLKKDLTEFGDPLVDLEPEIGFDLAPPPSGGASEAISTITSIGRALYFCVPRNQRLLAYWDTVADRLFKIRNSLNLQGIFRQLPLFDPPVDPALLARAAAAGLDISAIVSGLNQPLPLVRFHYLLQRALEICQQVMALGNNLLSAIEKQDAEALALLRAQHETTILQDAEVVKYAAFQEATKSREAVAQTIKNFGDKYKYYQRLLGADESSIKIPTLDDLDKDGLNALRFTSSEPTVDFQPITVEIANQPSSVDTGGHKLNSDESAELDNLQSAKDAHNRAAGMEKTGSTMAVLPMFGARFEPLGCGGTISFGGANLAALMTLLAQMIKTEADNDTYQASISAKMAGYTRREQDWKLLSNVAAGEMTAALKQLRAAQIREAMAEREWSNHKTAIAQAQEIEQFLSDPKKGKTTNKGFYVWLRGEVKKVYTQCFNLAFEAAKKAERALENELGDPNLTYVQYGYLAGKEGLLAGEKLYYDLKRMELAWADLNRREYEMTKNVSLLQLDPVALLRLRTTGTCFISLPESLFDFDAAGQYFRRIWSVGASVPCVAGPFTSVTCRLTLLRSSIRKSPLVGDAGYPRQGADDDRFSDFLGSMQSIVTSSAQNDPCVFDPNAQDERNLPFRYAGLVSEWQIDMPNQIRQFDHETISDVILHIRYTAREGGETLRNAAVAELESAVANATANGSVRLFSMRHDFPTEWAKFKAFKLGGAAHATVRSVRTGDWSCDARPRTRIQPSAIRECATDKCLFNTRKGNSSIRFHR